MGVLGILVLTGCAHPKFSIRKFDLVSLANQVCVKRDPHRSIKGSVWMRVKSKEASGQFPAAVLADGAGKLKMEVTNLLGGTEAVITVDGTHYLIQVPNKPERKEEGYGYWGGIPLQWAADTFVGYLPCPAGGVTGAKIGMGTDEDLIVQTVSSLGREPERFVYHFREREGKPWVDSLQWERMGALKSSVEFKFYDPNEETGIPQKWEARSSQGEVKVLWKERESSSK